MSIYLSLGIDQYLREDVPARIDKMCVLFVRVRDPFTLKRLKTNSVELLF